MRRRVKPWQVTIGLVAAAVLVAALGARALRPAPIRAKAPAGSHPVHYEIEFGPRPGQLEGLKQAGLVPNDAIDNGRGSFVSPSSLTPAELDDAERVVKAREARRAARSGR